MAGNGIGIDVNDPSSPWIHRGIPIDNWTALTAWQFVLFFGTIATVIMVGFIYHDVDATRDKTREILVAVQALQACCSSNAAEIDLLQQWQWCESTDSDTSVDPTSRQSCIDFNNTFNG